MYESEREREIEREKMSEHDDGDDLIEDDHEFMID